MIDLHFHSTYSDGKLSIPELAELIKKSGLKYCALTDHDTIAGISELKKCLHGSNIVVIPGVELTALCGNNEIHILAYNFDIEVVGEVLNKRNKLIKKQKVTEMKKAISLFRKEGLKINNNLNPDEKKPVGYTVAMNICQHQSNLDLLFQRHKKILSLDDIYFNYQAPGKPCAVKRSGVSVKWLLNKLQVRATYFIITHPFLQVSVATNPLSENEIHSLLDIGLSGVEIYHDKTTNRQIQSLIKMVNEKNLHYTGGSDFHGRKNDVGLGMYGIGLKVPYFKISKYELK